MGGMGAFATVFLGFLDPANFGPHALIGALPFVPAFFLWRFPVTDAEVDRCLSVTPDE